MQRTDSQSQNLKKLHLTTTSHQIIINQMTSRQLQVKKVINVFFKLILIQKFLVTNLINIKTTTKINQNLLLILVSKTKQILLNLQIALSGWLTGHYNFRCQPVDYSNSPRTLRVRGVCVAFRINTQQKNKYNLLKTKHNCFFTLILVKYFLFIFLDMCACVFGYLSIKHECVCLFACACACVYVYVRVCVCAYQFTFITVSIQTSYLINHS